jgi:hypothetical protein
VTFVSEVKSFVYVIAIFCVIEGFCILRRYFSCKVIHLFSMETVIFFWEVMDVLEMKLDVLRMGYFFRKEKHQVCLRCA